MQKTIRVSSINQQSRDKLLALGFNVVLEQQKIVQVLSINIEGYRAFRELGYSVVFITRKAVS